MSVSRIELVGAAVTYEQEKQSQHDTYEAPEIYLCVEIWLSFFCSPLCYLAGCPHGSTSPI
jgi:hypothetical protein